MPLVERLQTHPHFHQGMKQPKREKQKGQEKEKVSPFLPFAFLLLQVLGTL
jgi:hypothetical protein